MASAATSTAHSATGNFKRSTTRTVAPKEPQPSGELQRLAPTQSSLTPLQLTWITRYGRLPIQSQIFYCPEDVQPETAVRWLANGRKYKGLISLFIATAYTADPNKPTFTAGPFTAKGISGPFCERLLLFMDTGLTVVLNTYLIGEIPEVFRKFLFESRLILADPTSQLLALTNTDSRMLGLQVAIDSKYLLETLDPPIELSDTNKLFDASATCNHFFHSDTPVVLPPLALTHILLGNILTVATIFDLATLLLEEETLYPSLAPSKLLVTATVQTTERMYTLGTTPTTTECSSTGTGTTLTSRSVTATPFRSSAPNDAPRFATREEVDADFRGFLKRVKDNYDDYFETQTDFVWTDDHDRFTDYWFEQLLQQHRLPNQLHKFFYVRIYKFVEAELREAEKQSREMRGRGGATRGRGKP